MVAVRDSSGCMLASPPEGLVLAPRLGRFGLRDGPPGKRAAYKKSQENFHKAARFFDPALERVEMPFKGRSGEGTASTAA